MKISRFEIFTVMTTKVTVLWEVITQSMSSHLKRRSSKKVLINIKYSIFIQATERVEFEKV
jgi:hypothetical protein